MFNTPGMVVTTTAARSPTGKDAGKVTKMEWVTVFVLGYVNLINYMDRFTLAGVLNDVKTAFNIDKSQQGLLQTIFVMSHMVWFSPPYLVTWAIATPEESLWPLVFFCGVRRHYWIVCGIGEASFCTIAPTIISDLFLDDVRSRMLVLFYFAFPVGGVLGYIVGAQAARIGEAWYWSLRVTPVLGVVAVILILFLMVDPPRGEREGATALKPTSWGEDCKYLFKNKSFMLSTLGFTCVTFVTGAFAWWGPTYIYYGLRLQEGNTTYQGDVSFVYGIITLISFIIGVPLGAITAAKLRRRNRRADPLVCAFGLLVSTPFLFGGALLARYHETLCFVSIFFGELFLNLNWSIVADMLLYVVIPTRRATAEAFQILLSHALGDASSPYLIGIVADAIKVYLQKDDGTSSTTESSIVPSMTFAPVIDPEIEFESLQYSLFTTVLVQLFGGLFFLATSWFIVADKKECDATIAETPDAKSSFRPRYRVTQDSPGSVLKWFRAEDASGLQTSFKKMPSRSISLRTVIALMLIRQYARTIYLIPLPKPGPDFLWRCKHQSHSSTSKQRLRAG